ncbi:LysR family transcriptional regulator [Trinickia caryophylli]|uniref:Transcriptional regulator, LysR family n=1 Tax=Trinickia caryophylli TaxID=28094 RepID=A0A1X7CJ80_TRICW|nr:LysR family transcriptional regulator [Trinickia caryophylli]PMS11494.1 LysR family transcriptional regulator [Trinickia caryophylli]TRX19955.1 LysR family transcriptional regulator [Trinickia caryophylli]WQE12707.1 LysR family transcriptional regulator [Trinickia caryophylli]SME97601.1 transcriptional regulator, LysR family [Trinickia caryophylli]GLU30414.1 LysR family transcriptional regulator [Trinickia caryophylli]
MSRVDLNLLNALDALLSERSVTGAARRLNLSVSAMSRTLARLRAATGDRLLLQAGRTLVLTPYAEQLSERIPMLVREAQAALSRAEHPLDIATLSQRFTLRAGEGFIDLLGAALFDRIRCIAPGVQLRFTPKPDWNAQPLREGAIDLEIGIVRTSAPEVRTRLLFRDRYVGVCRIGHPLLSGEAVDLERWTAYGHVVASRTGEADGPVDALLEPPGSRRKAPMIVPSYTSAMQVARHSDLLAVVPHSCLGNRFMPDYASGNGLQSFELPLRIPAFNVSAIWHPRLDHDPAHRWLRAEVHELCLAAYPRAPHRAAHGEGAGHCGETRPGRPAS